MESAVRERYSQASKEREAALCCPVTYAKEYLAAIPAEVIERDYGCGDPSTFLRAGETVLDLGSGGGKICFIAAQIVGGAGKVIGIDLNDEMLALARGARAAVAEKIGFANVEFKKGRIQDLRLDREALDLWLRRHPVKDEAGLVALEAESERLRREAPLIPDGSVDVVVSSCVLNLVSNRDKAELFREIFRVLKRGGRAVISDIVADEPVPAALQQDGRLWSGCIAGAFEEAAFLRAFTAAGFYGVELVKRDDAPWQTVAGIEFRSATVVAFKGKDGECWDHNEAVIYKGPFSSVSDDDGHTFPRGERVAVCRKTFEIYMRPPYAAHFHAVAPRIEVASSAAPPFPCTGGALRRSPRASKGEDYALTAAGPRGECDDGACC